MADAGAEVFDEHLDAWLEWRATPWGRIRYRVVAETLARTCASLGSGRLRVLDVGGGDGGDALPLARAGHDVTIVDVSRVLLAQASSAADAEGMPVTCLEAGVDDLDGLALGTFDLVLCHNVVQYRSDLAGTLAVLARHIASRGAVSVIAPNPAADVMAAAIAHEEPAQAHELLSATHQRAATFGHDVRRIPVQDAVAGLTSLGLSTMSTFGILAVTHLVPNTRKGEPDFYADLEALELELCDREPYLRVARLWQVVAHRRP